VFSRLPFVSPVENGITCGRRVDADHAGRNALALVESRSPEPCSADFVLAGTAHNPTILNVTYGVTGSAGLGPGYAVPIATLVR
jgi:hypothetical protein